MERPIDHDLNLLRQDLLQMGGLVEEMIRQAIQALTGRDSQLAAALPASDRRVDELEKKIDEECLHILARHQPTAVDLRMLVAVMKIVNDLERMGDSAVNIAQAVALLNEQPPLKPYIDLPRLAQVVSEMVHGSLDAFVAGDSAQAMAVWQRDDEADNLYRKLFQELLGYMTQDPAAVSRALHLLLISRNLERIGDHATNIAEDVIYYIEGRDIRHSATKYETSKT